MFVRSGRLVLWLWIGAVLLALPDVPAAAEDAARGPSGQPVPRFASLRADEVNMRTGPGVRYPIEWVFRRRAVPVEIVAEFGTWRRVRDWQGAEGWIHESMLSRVRTVIVRGGIQPLRVAPDASAGTVARVEADVTGRLIGCQDHWCEVEIGAYRGWLRRGQFWGVGPGEDFE